MALFGRRKPGFSKEVELKPSEIPGEFSDALDPAMNGGEYKPAVQKPPEDSGDETVAENGTCSNTWNPCPRWRIPSRPSRRRRKRLPSP